MPTDPPEPASPSPRDRSRGRIALLAVPMVAFTVCTYVGNALAPTLAHDAPVVLLCLSPKLRWLFLVSPTVDTVWFFALPLARASLVLGTYFLLGRWYGDRSLRWLEVRSGDALRPVLWIERKFHRARGPITFVFPGSIAALLAGSDRMPAARFSAIALSSIALRVWAVRSLADAFRGTLLDVLDWVGENQIWLTVVSATAVVAWIAWSNRHGITTGETVEEIIEDFEPDPEPS